RIAQYTEIAARLPMALQKTPISIGVVTQQTLKDQQAHILSDALKNISGVTIQNSLGTQDYFLIRGFESSSAGMILLDGTREPNESHFKFYGFGFYDLYNVEQIEVIKGPAAFLYGGNTLSGVVNLGRKRPIYRTFAEVSMSHSQYQSYRETIDVGFFSHDSLLACRVNGVWQASQKFREHAYNRNYAVNPVILWNLKDHGTLTANLEYIHRQIKPDMGIPLYIPAETWELPAVPRTTSYQTPFDEVRNEIFRLRLNYQRDLGKTRQFRNKLFFTYLTGDSRFTLNHIPYRDKTGTWLLDRQIYSFTETQPCLGNQSEIFFQLNQGTVQHKLVTGLEIGLFKNRAYTWTTLLNSVYFFNPIAWIQDFEDLTTFKLRVRTDVRTWLIAPYIVDYITFSDQFQLFCGGRMDWVNFDTNRRDHPFDYVSTSLSSENNPFSKNYLHFSPTLGAVLKDSERLWFYLNFGKSFGASARVMDAPEKSTQYEIGYKYATPNGKYFTSGAIFYLQKENISIPLTGPLQGDLHAASGSQSVLGFELEMTTQPIRNLFCFFTYAFMEAELLNYTALTASQYGKLTLADFSNQVPTFVPRQIMNFWLTKEFLYGWSCGAGMQYVGSQFINLENTFETDDYFLYNLMVSYKFHNYQIRLNLDNLTRSEFLTRGLGPFSVIPAGDLVINGALDVTF
ncbi:TonB-dependent receptor, partial [candidate division KSB1 bacterium]|nr:TonB-dependent receptor [candidate division KSB1 bacterium]